MFGIIIIIYSFGLLINSAAIGFENLTPRGNYVDILQTNEINLPEI